MLSKFKPIYRLVLPFIRPLGTFFLLVCYRHILEIQDAIQRERLLGIVKVWRHYLYPPEDYILEKAKIEQFHLWVNLCESEGGNLFFGIPFESYERSIISKLVKPEDVFFDVGANIGIYALMASELVGQRGKVHAFEPIHSTFEILKQNIRLNKSENIVANHIAVEEKSGEAEIFFNRESTLASLGQTGRGEVVAVEKVKTVSLDYYLESQKIPHVNFLKIDVEGYEGHVLRGAQNLIGREHDLIILCELAEKNFKPLNLSVNEVINWMREYGYEAWGIDTQQHRLVQIEESTSCQGYSNFLFAHPDNRRYQSLLAIAQNENYSPSQSISLTKITSAALETENQSTSLIYVDCGARGDSKNLLVEATPNAHYIGFEPDPEECAKLAQLAGENYHYFPTAVGKNNETKDLYITKNPACSSLLKPNNKLWDKFLDCPPQMEIQSIKGIQTITLDTYLPNIGIPRIDFLELDTQGTELEILQGARGFLGSTILGLRVEVEFAPLYEEQPLFSEVDAYLRKFGFILFDLSRHRFRRQNYPRDFMTRGQLLYGHAFYLKDYSILTDDPGTAIKIAYLAAFYGFYDYSTEIIRSLRRKENRKLEPTYATMLVQINQRIASSKINSHLLWSIERLENSPFGKLFRHVISICNRISETYSNIIVKTRYYWND